MTDEDERPTTSELAASISAADRQSKQQEPEMRFIWDVPPRVKPHVSLGFALFVIGCLLLIPPLSLLTR